MKKFFLHMLLVSVLGMLTVSCRDEYEEAMAPESSKAQVVFSVAMDTPVSRTRAAETWGNNDDPSAPGTPFDNRIDIDQLIVKIVDGNGDEYKITDIMKWKSGDNGYKFVGVVKDVTEAITLTDAKVYVYANMGTETPAETFEQDADYIPMWGVKKVSLSFAPGKRENAGEISLLRAMAKLEVKLANNEEMNEYKLTSAKLNKYNKKGNTHPTLTDGFNGNTESLGLEGVLNMKNIDEADAGTDLALTKTEDGSSYVVYLPEVVNGTSETDWLKISVTLKEKKGDGTETGSFYIMNYPPQDQNQEPEAINIVRNHWYQYTINGFAASEIQVSYNAVDWNNVNITIGGEGFLHLDKDLIEIYNSNISEDDLKFYSSSPITSIELKDLYTHDRDGNIVEGTTDGVSAYYISKYGQKIQLGTDPGFDITDEEAALAREKVILSNISATAEENTLNGYITINSPFLADPTNEIPELQQNSHYDTPRYLEFLVTNQQGLTATFRVMQYPPVVITNIEGYFSYREDFRIGNLDHAYDVNQFSGSYPSCIEMPEDNGEPTHYHNPTTPFFVLAGFYPYHVHEWDPVKNRMIKKPTNPTEADGTCPSNLDYDGFDEIISGLMERDYHRIEEYKGSPKTGVYHRTHYLWDDNTAFVGGNIGKPANYYQNVGPVYEKQYEVDDIDPETGNVIGKKTITKYYRRHYTGNSFNIFYSKFVELPVNSDGTGVIGSQRCQYDYTAPYTMWSVWYPKGNHRMYHIRTTVTSDEYIIGKPNMITIDGRTYTGEGEVNSRMVSPSFMVASMLGETAVPKDRDGYVVPKEGGLYPLAQRQCEQYVETHFEDTNGNGTWEEGEPVTHYNDWRLPTKAEVALIAKYQKNSRAMDYLLPGETYYCASSVSGVYTAETVLSDPLEGAAQAGYYMRCVRDVKPNENK